MVVEVEYGRCILDERRRDIYLCTDEGGCVGACPYGALRTDGGRLEVTPEDCTDCNACVDKCDLGALVIQ